MPKKKISLEEAFQVFEQHGLQVSIKAVEQAQPVHLADFLETPDKGDITHYPPKKVDREHMKVTLYAAHTVGNGGELVVNPDGSKSVINNGIQTYGPGIVTVPTALAPHLLHQDAVARATDERAFDGKFRSFVIMRRGNVDVGLQVSESMGFDLSGFLGGLGDHQLQRI